MTTRTYDYGPYKLLCTATPAPGGGFAATLEVALEHGSASEKTPVPLSGGPFPTEDEAIAHAQAQGGDWVDENG